MFHVIPILPIECHKILTKMAKKSRKSHNINTGVLMTTWQLERQIASSTGGLGPFSGLAMGCRASMGVGQLRKCPRNNHTICHSVLDTESTVRTFWIPAPCFRRDMFRRNDTGSFIVKSFQRHHTSCFPPQGIEQSEHPSQAALQLVKAMWLQL